MRTAGERQVSGGCEKVTLRVP